MSTSPMPVYAISHGGGPWPWMKGAPGGSMGDWTALETALTAIPTETGRTPAAVLCVTAHWVTPHFTVGAAAAPPMLYDYGGFPDFTYRITYPAPGSPALARRAAELIASAGFPVTEDDRRGFDHGTFVPLAVVFPDAGVPIVQLSIRRDFDPTTHLNIGRALAPLRDEDVLLVCSGVPTFHNFSKMGPASAEPSRRFDRWLTDAVVGHRGDERAQMLTRWVDAPSARDCHPQEDHLVPLFVAAGAAWDDTAAVHYHEDAAMGFTASSGYRFGPALPAPLAAAGGQP